MDLVNAKQIITTLHNGAAYSVEYKTAVKTTSGADAWKVVKATFRLGVRYANLKQNVGKTVGSLPGNGKWIVDRYIYQDNNGYKLRVTNGMKGKRKIHYEDTSGNMLQPSDIVMKSSSGFVPVVQSIKLENVISIDKKN